VPRNPTILHVGRPARRTLCGSPTGSTWISDGFGSAAGGYSRPGCGGTTSLGALDSQCWC
jgi:hypothetical protein